MKFFKKSITAKIIASYLLMILTSMIVVGLVFNFASRNFLERSIKKDLRDELSVIEQRVRDEFNPMRRNTRPNIEPGLSRIPEIRIRNRRNLVVSNTTIMVLNKDMTVLSPMNNEEAVKVKSVLAEKLIANNKGEEKINIEGKPYLIVYSAIQSNPKFWVVLYAPGEPAQRLSSGTLLVLLLPLTITSFLAVLFGIFFARSIARPIIALKNRAEKLSVRDFDTRVDIHTGDELEELANSINKVSVELKEYDIAQKKFLQNASHELKTPLMSIQGYAEGIKDGVFDDNEKALEVIVEESTRLKKLVEELIFLSKLETMEDFYRFGSESINEIIEKSVEKVNSLAVKSNIKINLSLQKDLKLKVDKDKLTQALINILGNCLRYARSSIAVGTADMGNYFKVVITDDGEGFGEEDLKNLFVRFYKGKKGKTGLGLAITKVIIEKHEGTIEVRNSSKGGAEFIIMLRK